MTVRTKAELATLIADSLEDGGSNTAAEVRTVLNDIIDSLATQAALDAVTARVATLEGGGQTPVVTHTNFLGIKATDDFVVADFTVSSVAPGQIIPGSPTWADGDRNYVAFARPTTEGDFTYVYYYPNGNRNTNNQISAWEQLADTIELGGEDHNVIVSRGALRDSARGRVVEAGG